MKTINTVVKFFAKEVIEYFDAPVRPALIEAYINDSFSLADYRYILGSPSQKEIVKLINCS